MFGSDGGDFSGSRKSLGRSGAASAVVPGDVVLDRPRPSEKQKDALLPAAVSVFEAEKFLRSHEREFLCKLWTGLRERLMGTSLDSVSSLKDEVMLVLESMKRFEHANISCIEEFLESLFARAAAYDEARSATSDALTKEALARQLKDVDDRLREALDKEAEGVKEVECSEAELKNVEEQLELLTKRKQELSSSLVQQRESLREAAAEVGEIHGELVTLRSMEPSDERAVEALRVAEAELVMAKDELEGLNPFS